MWSSPPTTGSRPPPCAGFSFTAIDSHRGVLFGGYSPGRGRINDIHIINMQTMVCLCVDMFIHKYDYGCLASCPVQKPGNKASGCRDIMYMGIVS